MFNEPEELGVPEESSLKHVSVLGGGSFGSVSLMRDSNGRCYAKKFASFNYEKNLSKELNIMLYFRNHPRIVQASSSLLHLDINPEGCHIYMEFASKGTLFNMIYEFRALQENNPSEICDVNSRRGKAMPEDIVGRAAFMILQGLYALHSHGYVHCDLKPSNILVFPSTTFEEPWDLKLADFGSSKEPSTDSRVLFPGTKEYMPPESLGYDGVMGSSVDIWSLGCVVIEMFGGYPMNMGEYYMWNLPNVISPVAKDFLRRCLAMESSLRPTAAELLSHPFVAHRVISVPLTTEMLPLSCFFVEELIQGGVMV